MRFWARELAGWILVGIGLLIFYICFALIENHGAPPRLFEAGPLSLIGIIVFRGGIHLLKVAVAARVCLQAQEQLGANQSTGRVFGRQPTKDTARPRFTWPPPERRGSVENRPSS